MRFRTELNLQISETNIDHTHPCLLIGSCFTSHIGAKFTRFKFSTLVNPYGTIYHPIPLFNQLSDALLENGVVEDQIITLEDRFVHYGYHSDCWATSPQELIDEIEKRNAGVRAFIKKAEYVIITFGTAYQFTHLNKSIVVANCHKQPSNLFSRDLSTVNDLIRFLSLLISLIQSNNKKAKVIFTVSPVRHLGDGLVENSLSKAHLLTAVHQVCEKYNSAYYFPAYELVIDDLRDYRFYKEDLIHPNDMAVEYIWSFFTQTFFTEQTQSLIKQIGSFQKTLGHRPFHSDSLSHQRLLTNLETKIQRFAEHQGLDMSMELNQIHASIK